MILSSRNWVGYVTIYALLVTTIRECNAAMGHEAAKASSSSSSSSLKELLLGSMNENYVKKSTGALLRAAYEGDLEKVLSLLEEGVPVNSANSAGLQALHFAAKSGHVDVASELIKSGATVNASSAKGHTALHVASLLGQREIVKLLLRRGALVNIQSQCFEDNFTPLYMAAQIGHQEIATLLLAHGADPTIATKNGSTPRDVASQQGYRALAELLEEYERRIANGSDDRVNTESLDGASGQDFGARLTVKPPSVFNRDVITSPRNSPMRATSLDQYLRSTNQAAAAKPS